MGLIVQATISYLVLERSARLNLTTWTSYILGKIQGSPANCPIHVSMRAIASGV